MLIDQPKEIIVKTLMEQAAREYGEDRAEVLRPQIEDTAQSLALVARFQLDLGGDEPDFLVAPQTEEEGR